MNLTVDIQSASAEPVPEEDNIRHWIDSALRCAPERSDAEVSIRLVDEAEMAELNSNYRGQNGATNVLSFPFETPPGMELPLLGDLAICAKMITNKTKQQQKSLHTH